MVKKITYSRRHPEKKRQAPFDFDLTHGDESDRKRTKVNGESDESQLPTPPSGRQGKKAPASKNGAFSGPVSIPEDMDLEPLAESGKNLRVFKKVLNSGRYQAARPHDDNIQEDQEQFVEMLINGRKRKSHLPTPPAEAQKKAHQQTREGDTAMQLNGSAVKGELKSLKASPTSRTSQLFERIIKNEQPRVPYQPRAYKAAETAAPRKTIDGDLLSRNSREAHMWSVNQADSPFLRLPENVRDLIYKYTLGGKTININYETYRTSFDPTKPKVIQQVIPVFRYNCTIIDGRTNPYNAAAKPYMKTQTSLTLLNNICRQMYAETATLPYLLNMIGFGSHNIMVNFLLMEKRLSRQQLDAFTQLMLPDDLPGSNMLAYLRNVEKVYLAFEQTGKSSGWYRVDREDGERPILTRILKTRV